MAAYNYAGASTGKYNPTATPLQRNNYGIGAKQAAVDYGFSAPEFGSTNPSVPLNPRPAPVAPVTWNHTAAPMPRPAPANPAPVANIPPAAINPPNPLAAVNATNLANTQAYRGAGWTPPAQELSPAQLGAQAANAVNTANTAQYRNAPAPNPAAANAINTANTQAYRGPGWTPPTSELSPTQLGVNAANATNAANTAQYRNRAYGTMPQTLAEANARNLANTRSYRGAGWNPPGR